MVEQTKPSTAIEGPVVWEDECQGVLFQLEKLLEPRLVGSGARPYRLWRDGRPSTGGQWQYTIEGAKAEAARRSDYDLYSQIARLRLRVVNLERQLYEATK